MSQRTLIWLLAAALLLLSGCAHTPNTEVDRLSLIRSMVYTQRHLLEMELTEQHDPTRYHTLVMSYCDLIDRGAIEVSQIPKQCDGNFKGADHYKIRLCTAEFHRCIASCETRSTQCRACELQAASCLALTTPIQ